METELHVLYDALHAHKVSLSEILDQIDQNVLRAVKNFEKLPGPQITESKFKISMQIVEILPHYLEMLNVGKKIIKGLNTNLQEFYQDSPPPPPERQNVNPFLYDYEEATDIETETTDTDSSTIVNETAGSSESAQEVGMLGISETSLENDSDDSSDEVSQPDSTKVEASSELSDDTELEETPQKLLAVPEHSTKNKRRVTFNIPLNTANSKPKRNFNWKEEACKVLTNKNLKRNLNEKRPIFELPPEDDLFVETNCVFSHIISPIEFYIRTEQALFECLEDSINEDLNQQCQYVVNKFKCKADAKKKLGNFCFVFLADKRKWFRVQILDWLIREPDNIFIELIDYGIKIHCSYTSLKNMSEHDAYTKFPKMAIKCYLAGIYPPNPFAQNKWPKVSIDFFKELGEIQKKTEFKIIFVHTDGDSYAVDLQKANEPHSLGEILVQKSYACQITINDDSEDSELAEEASNINELIAGYDARDEARICPFTRSLGTCFKGHHCKLEHSELSKDGITTDKILTVREALHKFPLPIDGQVVEIRITGYVNSCEFYVHILNKRQKSNLYNDDFQNLQDLMNINNTVQRYESFAIYPGLGEVVLVKDGNKWCRGNCMGYTENDGIEIFYVDFGYKKVKKLKELRQMKDDFLYVPFQAVHCLLHDCQEKKDVDREAVYNFYSNCMYLNVFQAVVIESGEPLMLQLWDSNNMDMSYVLKEKMSFAERRVDLRPVRECKLTCG